MIKTEHEFPSFAAAFAWLYEDHEYADNMRGAYLSDFAGLAECDAIAEGGCCGSVDYEVLIAGKPARVGCNYGH